MTACAPDRPDTSTPPQTPRDPRHIGQLLRDARDDYLRRMNERRMFAAAPAIIAPAQELVLRYLDPTGTPVATILRRSGLPRAAFDAIVTDTPLATSYLTVDGGDLHYTAIGRSAFASMRRTQAAIEQTYLAKLDPVRYATTKEALAELAPRPDLDVPRNVGQLLRDARDDFMRRLTERRMFEPAPIQITPAIDLVLQYLDERGTPLAEIRERSGLPVAALQAVLDELMLPTRFVAVEDEALSYTELGLSAMATFRGTVAAIEDAYQSQLTQLRYAILREALAEIAPPRPDVR